MKSKHLPFLLGITAVIIYLYAPTIQWMYTRFIAKDSYYSHGFLIPFITIYLIWNKKDRLADISFKVSWWGLPVMLTAIFIHVAGMIFYVFSPSGFSIPLFVIGFCLFIYGAETTREIIFPLLFLFFMCPLPMGFVSVIASPMKMMVAKYSAIIVNYMGIPVFRDGFYVDTVKGQLLVGNPCSGLRSLISFLALGYVFSYITETSGKNKVLLLLSAIPTAFISNLMRVTFLILVTAFYGLDASSPGSISHDYSGFVVFALGVLLLFKLGQLVEWKK